MDINFFKRMIRVKSTTADEEIESLIESAIRDLEIAGIQRNETDPLYIQAIKLYVKSHYGYDKDTERFLENYKNLKDSMALSGEYANGN